MMIAGNIDGRTIYVAIVIDAVRLLANDAEADIAPASAEAVKVIRPRSPLVLATTAAQTVRQASNRIALDVYAGDTIRFYAKSGSNNFENAVLIEDINPIGDSGTLQDFTLVDMARNTVAPREDDSVFPARFPEQSFWFWQCAVTTDGESRCNVLLAVYDRDEQGRPRFAGRYRWGLQLLVTLTSPPSSVPTTGETS